MSVINDPKNSSSAGSPRIVGSRIIVDVPVRWEDLDPYRHVNNVAAFSILEEARIAALWKMGRPGELPSNAVVGGMNAEFQMFVVNHQIEYRAPLVYAGAPVSVSLWFTRLGAADCTVAYEVGEPGAPAIVAMSRLALIDAATGRPGRLPAEVRAAWEPFVGEPPRMRIR